MATKKASTKRVEGTVWNGNGWSVVYGQLKPGRGRPKHIPHLFKWVGEKIPFEALAEVEKHFASQKIRIQGVYMTHDSMGVTRYIGRGDVFKRLKSHKNANPHELAYFSFFLVENKQHEREIETLLIRAAGPQLEFNSRKKRVGIEPGDISDFEASTRFFERQYKRGPKKQSSSDTVNT